MIIISTNLLSIAVQRTLIILLYGTVDNFLLGLQTVYFCWFLSVLLVLEQASDVNRAVQRTNKEGAKSEFIQTKIIGSDNKPLINVRIKLDRYHKELWNELY